LIVDLPPGTADATLTVMQLLPLTGSIIVSTPQDLANMVVTKAVNMAKKLNVPILGVVENMSYVLSPDTGEKIELFGSSKIDKISEAANAPVLGQLPIDPVLAKYCDEGQIEEYKSSMFEEFSQSLFGMLENIKSTVNA